MAGLAPRLPLDTDSGHGYALIQDYKTLTQQNLKMILFTNPGERIMIPNFGVGVKRYLFDPSHEITFNDLKADIVKQVNHYLPYLRLDELVVDSNPEDENIIYLFMRYTIIPVGVQDYLDFTLEPGDA